MSNVVDMGGRFGLPKEDLDRKRLAGLATLQAQDASAKFRVMRQLMIDVQAFAEAAGPNEARELCKRAIEHAIEKRRGKE